MLDRTRDIAPGLARTILATMTLFCVAVPAAPSAALAQAVIDPGAVSRQNELAPPFELDRLPVDTGARARPAEKARPLAAEPALRPTVAPDAPLVTVADWQFAGNTLFTGEQLAAVVADLRGRDLAFGELQQATEAIAGFYADNGYLASATLPPQEITNGTILVEIKEARFGGVVFEGIYPQRVDSVIVEEYFARDLAPGAPLRPDDFDRPLLLANDLPGVSLSGVFAPGRNPGETVLILKSTDDPIGRAQLSVDNLGSRSTGEERVNAQVNLNSPLRLGDFAQGTVTVSEGLMDGRLRYSVPIGSSGLRASAHVDALDYEVVAPEFAALDSAGDSIEFGAGLSYPLIRSRDANLTLSLDHDRKRLTNSIRGTEVTDYTVNQTTMGLNGTYFDDFLGGGASALGVSFSHGAADGNRGAAAFDRSFDVWRLSASRQQYVAKNTTLFASFSAQQGPDDLDSSESFSLGGPLGVRAYPTGEASGPSGYVASLELRQRFFEDWTLKGFIDHGRIDDRSAPGEPSSYDLTGAGVSVVWDAPFGFRADLTYARRFGDNPNPIAINGKDQDGSLKEDRVWFSLSKAF